MIFKQEPYSTKIMTEACFMFKDHASEVGSLALNPAVNFEAYHQAAMQGTLRIYTARVEGTLIGYATYIVAGHPHYMDSKQATQLAIYLHPEHRKGSNGYKFMRYCDMKLTDEEVDVIYCFSSVNRDLGKMLNRMGYQETEKVYARRL